MATTETTRERPILFSAPMIRAILAGTKTQTRRVVNPQPPTPEQFPGSSFGMWKRPDADRWEITGSVGVARDNGFRVWWKPYCNVGDRLWVRENVLFHPANNFLYKIGSGRKHHAADLSPDELKQRKHEGWRCVPSIHMPRWASRIILEVTGVRVERLQDIGELDALAEGVECERIIHGTMMTSDGKEVTGEWADGCARDGYRNLWDSINGADPAKCWKASPWVWVVSFRRVDAGK